MSNQDKEYLIKKTKNRDVPIITALLKSQVFNGKEIKEEFTDSRGNQITILSSEKLNEEAFGYYGKCLKLVNYRNSKELTFNAREFCLISGIEEPRTNRDASRIRDHLVKVTGVRIGEKIDGKYSYYSIINKFEYDTTLDSITMTFHDDFVKLAKKLHNKHFDMDMYSIIKSPTGRALMRWLDGVAVNNMGIWAVQFRKSELIDHLNMVKTGDSKIKEENRVLKVALDQLVKCNFLASWVRVGKGEYRNDPIYTFNVLDKKLRTAKKDAEDEVAQEKNAATSKKPAKNNFKTKDDYKKEILAAEQSSEQGAVEDALEGESWGA